MKAVIFATLLAAAGMVQAQSMGAPEPMKMAPQVGPSGAMDAAEAPMLAQPSSTGNFRTWYAGQKSPAVVVYFNRTLNDLPDGWQGSKRLLIEDTLSDARGEDKRTITVGVQHNTQGQARVRTEFAKLFEQSLSAELKKQNVRLLDSTVLHRKLSADKQGRSSDLEYDSLNRSARFVLEIEIMSVNGEALAVANLKDLRSGDVTASVRQGVSSLQSVSDIDQLARSLARRLMDYKVM